VTADRSAGPQMMWLSFVGNSPVRSVKLDRATGRFWRAEVVRGEDERSVRIYFIGLTIPATRPSGRQVDQLHVQLDEVAIEIKLSVTVKSAPQPPARIPEPPPSRPASPPSPPQPTYAAARRSRSGKAKRIVAGLVLLRLQQPRPDAVVLLSEAGHDRASQRDANLGDHGAASGRSVPCVVDSRISILGEK